MKYSRRKVNNLESRTYRRCFSWSKLPGKIIFKISKKLETRDDILRFKGVCSKWRKRCPTPPVNLLSFNVPLPRMIKDSFKVLPFHNSTRPLVLRVSSIYLITPSRGDVNCHSSKPWMIMAEELNPGKIKLRNPLTAKRVQNSPPFLDMTRFQALKLAEGFNFKSTNCVNKVLLWSSSTLSLKVLVLYYKGTLGKLSLEVLGSRVDDDGEDEEIYSWEKFNVPRGGKFCFMYLDDVTRYADVNYGVDRKGRLYGLDTESMTITGTTVLVSEPVCRGDIPSTRRKRLVVDPSSGELHLVVREKVLETQKVRFKVYKLNEQGKRWDAVESIGNERVLFVGIDHCFFALARHFPGCEGNAIVFAANCFTQYNGCDAPDRALFGDDEGVEVGVYRMGEGDNFRLLSSACPEFSGIIWPPPDWFCTWECNEETEEENETREGSDEVGNSSFVCLSDNHAEGLLSGSSSSAAESASDDHNNDCVGMLSDSSDHDDGQEDEDEDEDDDEEEDAYNEVKVEVDDERTSSGCSGNADSEASNKSEEAHIPKSNVDSDANLFNRTGKKHSDIQTIEEHPSVQEQSDYFALPLLGFEEGTTGSVRRDSQTPVKGPDIMKRVCNAKNTPATPVSLGGEKSSTVKFQGVDIRSELLPTLQTIWAKHGNLIGINTVQNKRFLKCAMEELAELIITLQNTTARALTEAKIDDMRSTLSGIQCTGQKVDWLEPVIQKATDVLKSRPFIESIATIMKKKAKIEEEEKEFLAITAKKKQELEKDRARLSTRVPFAVDEIIDLDDILGDGI